MVAYSNLANNNASCNIRLLSRGFRATFTLVHCMSVWSVKETLPAARSRESSAVIGLPLTALQFLLVAHWSTIAKCQPSAAAR